MITDLDKTRIAAIFDQQGWTNGTQRHVDICGTPQPHFSIYLHQLPVGFVVAYQWGEGYEEWILRKSNSGYAMVVQESELALVAEHPRRAWRVMSNGKVAACDGDLAAAIAWDKEEVEALSYNPKIA